LELENKAKASYQRRKAKRKQPLIGGRKHGEGSYQRRKMQRECTPLLEVENKARASYQEGKEKSIPLILLLEVEN
jgi:hypothetical protein